MSGGTGRHDSDPIKLLKIYEIYAEWLGDLNKEDTLYVPQKTTVGEVLEKLNDDIARARRWRDVRVPDEKKEDVAGARNEQVGSVTSYKEDGKDVGWPKIAYGPVTLASDQYHTVLIILDADTTPEQERYVSKRFFNLIEFRWTRHDPILDLDWITDYLEPLARELEGEGLTRIQ